MAQETMKLQLEPLTGMLGSIAIPASVFLL